jgi:cytidine deaminase
MTPTEIDKLCMRARTAAQRAHTPYSDYPVGAALVATNGDIFTGCNVESSSFGLTVCAERNAIACALAAGAKQFKALAIYSRNGATPCGACRQVIWDICGNILVILCDINDNVQTYRITELLPHPFDARKL